MSDHLVEMTQYCSKSICGHALADNPGPLALSAKCAGGRDEVERPEMVVASTLRA